MGCGCVSEWVYCAWVGMGIQVGRGAMQWLQEGASDSMCGRTGGGGEGGDDTHLEARIVYCALLVSIRHAQLSWWRRAAINSTTTQTHHQIIG